MDPLSLPSLDKASNPYTQQIPPNCHPKKDHEDKTLKMKDPESFKVNITIGGKEKTQAMLDLGVSINIMPYSVYLRLGLGKLKLNPMTLQLEDGSLKRLKSIVEDLLVQVDKFKVPMDFIVLEMKGAPLRQKEHMVLLGRLFMVTTKIVIDVQNGKLTMTVLVETVHL